MALRLGRSRLPELLAKVGKSQRDLANYLDVSDSYISQIISGVSEFSVVNRKKAANFLQCDSSDDLNEWLY